jgi:ribosomal protein S27AE
MSCPNCGALMNLHAEKPVKEPSVPEGELILFVYCCPSCGKVVAEEKQM